MVDTQRSLSAIQTLFADNSAGAISPQDLRDGVETLRPGHGEIYVSSTAATSFTDTTSFGMAAGTYTFTAGYNWAMDTNGQLKYTGAATRAVHIASTISMISGNNNQVVNWAVAKNGTVLTASITSRKIGTGADVGSTAVHGFTTVSTNDYLTTVVRNTSWTGAETVTANFLNLFVMDMPT